MSRDKHTEDLRNVRSGDSVRVTPTDGPIFRAECTDVSKQNADPRSGEVRETTIWHFKVNGEEMVFASILDGLRSSPDDPEFPQHSELWHESEQRTLGYIEDVTIYGKMEA